MQIPEKNNYFKLQTPLTRGEVSLLPIELRDFFFQFFLQS